MSHSRAIAIALVAFLSHTALGQTIVYLPDSGTSGSANTIPFNGTSWGTNGYTSLTVYPAAAFAAAGVTPSMTLTDLAIVPVTAGSGTINIPTGRFLVGHIAPGASVPNQWQANFLNSVTMWDTAQRGAITFPWTGVTWSSLPIDGCARFSWDGVNDVAFFETIGPAWTGGFSVTTSATPYTRHGLSGYNPAPGTAQTTTGTLGMRARFTFSNGISSDLNVTTAGGGVGDLSIGINGLPPAASEGYILVSTTTTGYPNTGPVFGIVPDAVTWSGINSPGFPGNPLHYLTGFPGYFPSVPFVVGPGSLSFLVGQTWDFVGIYFAPGFQYIGRSCVSRVTF